jgi:hypothetical protein
LEPSEGTSPSTRSGRYFGARSEGPDFAVTSASTTSPSWRVDGGGPGVVIWTAGTRFTCSARTGCHERGLRVVPPPDLGTASPSPGAQAASSRSGSSAYPDDRIDIFGTIGGAPTRWARRLIRPRAWACRSTESSRAASPRSSPRATSTPRITL